MDTLIIKITNSKAHRLLQDLEDLNLIKILNSYPSKSENLSEKYAGKLPTSVAEEMNEYVSHSRKEWEKRDIY